MIWRLLFSILFTSICSAVIIPADRQVEWSPGKTVGVRGGVVNRTDLIQGTSFGVSTNRSTVVGSIDNGTNLLVVMSAGDFVVSNGVYIAGAVTAQITNITFGTNFWLHSPNFGSTVSGAVVEHDNTYPIYFAQTAAVSNQAVVLPSGVVISRGGVVVNKSYTTLRGQGTNTILFLKGIGSVQAGGSPLQNTQAKYFVPTNGVPKGATNCTLTTSSFVPFGDVIRVGEIYQISQLNGSDTNFRVISVSGFERIVSQNIVIESVVGNDITFWPPLVWHFTNSPFMLETFASATRGFGLENMVITLTNTAEATAGSFTDIVLFQGMVDSWVRGCSLIYANNYNMHFYGSINCEFGSNFLGHALSGGTSHSGLLFEGSTGLLIQDNVFDDFGFGLQQWGNSTMGCAIFANFFTNIAGATIIYHNTHHMMNLYEENVISSYFQLDGYYGSNSHETLFRNAIPNTISIKRFSSKLNFVGNVIGSTAFNFYYDLDNNHGGTFALFSLGEPNIGNANFTGTAPPMPYNWPQTDWVGVHGDPAFQKHYVDTAFKITSTVVQATNLVGDFSGWPYDPNGAYTFLFQDGANTNVYHTLAQQTNALWAGSSLSALAPPTTTNMLFNHAVNLTNGWTIIVSSPDNYQQLQSIDNTSHIRHGNLVTTNSIAVLAWDPGIADHVLDSSLLYTSGQPSWWGTNRWPAVDPESGFPLATIPAQSRIYGFSITGGGGNPIIETNGGLYPRQYQFKRATIQKTTWR